MPAWTNRWLSTSMPRRWRTLALVLAGLVAWLGGAVAEASTGRDIAGPYYPLQPLDAYRSLWASPILAGGSSLLFRWRYTDDRRHVAIDFPMSAGIRYATYQSDDPETIVFLGGEDPSRRCPPELTSYDACPYIIVWLSQDGGQQFQKRFIRLPALQAMPVEDHSIPVIVVRRHVLYLAIGGDARPAFRHHADGMDYLVANGEPLALNERIAIAYAAPETSDVSISAYNELKLKSMPVNIYAVALPPAMSMAAANRPIQSSPSNWAGQVCAYRRMLKASAGLPMLAAMPVVGDGLDRFGDLPVYRLPPKPTYDAGVLSNASYDEGARARLLDAWRTTYPDWVAAQPRISHWFPSKRTLDPDNPAARAKVDCGPDLPAWLE